ncbi:unnamed protein product [Caenorhabditis auriculariae]|uniref:Uncharacterized protein n=1 Tax=Caenorhabditis auriculariae TaxID=2777116 RepID=A0A8S1HL36_9PELO|nr:unnamed protein product [Caenorhabditis auriculariae]
MTDGLLLLLQSTFEAQPILLAPVIEFIESRRHTVSAHSSSPRGGHFIHVVGPRRVTELLLLSTFEGIPVACSLDNLEKLLIWVGGAVWSSGM